MSVIDVGNEGGSAGPGAVQTSVACAGLELFAQTDQQVETKGLALVHSPTREYHRG